MRTGNVILVVLVVAAVIGGVVWYGNQTGTSGLGVDQTLEQTGTGTVPATEDETVTTGVPDTDPAAADQPPASDLAGPEDDVIIAEDAVSEDAIVLEPTTEDPVILDPETTDTSVEVATEQAGDTASDGAGVAAAGGGTAPAADDPAPAAAGGDPASDVTDAGPAPATTGADAAPAPPTGSAVPPEQALAPAELLTPENFDSARALEVIAADETLTPEQRSSLRALVEGAIANPDMRDAAITEIRSALDLQPLP